MSQPLNALLFGGCLVRRPLRTVPGIEKQFYRSCFGDIRTVHSFGEMFQVLDVLTGRKDVPAELRPLTGVGPKMKPLEDQGVLRRIDVALIELGSPVDIIFRGVTINRSRVDSLLKPAASLNRESFKLCQKWTRVGLVGMNEEVRRALGGQIEKLLPDDEHSDLRCAVLHEARAEKSDIEGGFRKMSALLGCPIGVVIFVFRYMPDGRPVMWPAGTREDVVAAATALGHPVFEPVALVQEYTVARALEKDGRHYSPEFLPVVGEAIVSFAQKVHAKGAADRTSKLGPA